ncbi:MAG: glycosyltransferase family 39 protein [Candidatus Coatesbacteria bacterium]|nr:MAG: glycosyltransferase family 39 protein [Candidatus Coatesbacteria bacterium]
MMTNNSLSRRAEVVLLVLVFLLALAPRIWCFFHHLMPEGDAGNILEVGRNLAQGRGYVTSAKWNFYGELGPIVHPEGNRQPLVPLVAAATFAAGADSPAAARLLTLVASLAALALLYVVVRRWFGAALALGAAAVAALEPSLLWFSVRVQPEAWFALLFLAALAVAGDLTSERPSLIRPLAVGVLLSLSYLCRLNGAALFLAYVVALFLVYRGRAFLPAAISVGAFAVVALPWWIRNASVFGDPLYSEVNYFLFAPNLDQVWAIKRYVPSWSGFFATYGFFGLAGRFLRGLANGVEALLLGNLHLRESYKAAPLAAFVVLALVGLPRLRNRRALLFPTLALAAHLVVFAFFGGSLFRYFLPFYVLFLPLGLAGIAQAAGRFERRRRWVTAALVGALILPLLYPLQLTLRQDDRAEYQEVREVATWLADNTSPDEVVVTWPRVIQLLYEYDRPSLYWPGGGIREVLAVLTQYEARYAVVEPAALARRQNLKAIWYVGYKGLTKVPDKVSEDKLTIVRVDYGGDAFKFAYRPTDDSNFITYRIDHDELRATVYGTYLTGVQ